MIASPPIEIAVETPRPAAVSVEEISEIPDLVKQKIGKAVA